MNKKYNPGDIFINLNSGKKFYLLDEKYFKKNRKKFISSAKYENMYLHQYYGDRYCVDWGVENFEDAVKAGFRFELIKKIFTRLNNEINYKFLVD